MSDWLQKSYEAEISQANERIKELEVALRDANRGRDELRLANLTIEDAIRSLGLTERVADEIRSKKGRTQ